MRAADFNGDSQVDLLVAACDSDTYNKRRLMLYEGVRAPSGKFQLRRSGSQNPFQELNPNPKPL